MSSKEYKALCRKWKVRCYKSDRHNGQIDVLYVRPITSKIKPPVCVTVTRTIEQRSKFVVLSGTVDLEELENLERCIGFAKEYRKRIKENA